VPKGIHTSATCNIQYYLQQPQQVIIQILIIYKHQCCMHTVQMNH